MPGRPVRLAAAPADAAEVAAGLESLRAEVGVVSDWPADALAEAEHAARTGAAPGAEERAELHARADRTDIPFVTVDPAGSTDLDQAVHVAPHGRGWRVHYAIADVASFVRPGGALDAATQERGTTVYAPDGRVPLHPEVLSEGAASLLPGQARPAVLWRVDLDADGEPVDVQVERAVVRSRAQLTYEGVQEALDAGTADDVLAGVRAVGLLREERERARGGVSLDVPEQEVVPDPAGGWSLRFRRTLPVEGWNAQISLLTGAVAARIMLDAGVGVLRTLPPADARDVDRLRRTAAALEIPWDADEPYGDLLPRLDSAVDGHAAFLQEATSLFRGAAYVAFGGADGAPAPAGEAAEHAAIRLPYAHVTAPLRRLVDRYGTEVCLAVTAGREVPAWVRDALPGLPATMAGTGRRASAFDRGVLDLVEAVVLAPSVGRTFVGVVVDADEPRDGEARGQLQLREPAVRARVTGAAPLPLGDAVEARLTEASVPHRRVVFALERPVRPESRLASRG
ncbi:RNB domain-containing ribonuclease [Cellulomonas shaoxiangyii]|uniref:RNB domain-containing ribonuclease n=1 Tax=Cellulomonas shaoxiangyii TaxID=2566013 RepID=A0A4V1CME3_9CELL|nr:RNB domain-containing ribonuclease [Cellulomonas shaoxiangyii]QCB92645.1 RNB domain-containing ribonuclease [Cellulomonas shaoxiangyii]TGY85453.1 RNB domain-containing ribonuclease [Cellulomonas shaoxiangyii]